MAIYSVDVFSGSSDSIIRDPHAQAVIVKATQGTGYVNPLCNHQWDLAGSLGKLRGLYHYASGGNPVAEAQYFINNIKNYVGQGVLILDWESYQNSSWGNTNWARQFVNEVHRLTGVWPLIYVQESALWQVANCANDCGVWVAKYASMNWNSWSVPNMNVSSGSFGALSGWQYTGGDMDRSIWYLDADAWNRLAAPSSVAKPVTRGGSLDGYHFEGDKLIINGWFADSSVTGKPYRYVILTDKGGHELGRAKANTVKRPDVVKAFPKLAGDSGFTASLEYTAAMAQKINVILRYTDDPAGNGNFTDFTSAIDLSRSVACLDGMSVSFDKKLHVSGWFASDLAVGKPYCYVILYDTADKRELQRVKIDAVKRDDVKEAEPSVYGAGQSGFNAAFNYGADLVGRKLQIIARYSDDVNGEGKRVDYWFTPFNGPTMFELDGKAEQTFVAHSVRVDAQKDGTAMVTVK